MTTSKCLYCTEGNVNIEINIGHNSQSHSEVTREVLVDVQTNVCVLKELLLLILFWKNKNLQLSLKCLSSNIERTLALLRESVFKSLVANLLE